MPFPGSLMEQPAPWVEKLNEARLEQLDELYLTAGPLLFRAVQSAIACAFSNENKQPKPHELYEPQSAYFRAQCDLPTDDVPDPDTPPTPDQLAAKRLARHKHHSGLDSLGAFAKKTRKH